MELKEILKGGMELGEFYTRELIANLNPQSPLEKAKALRAIQEFSFNLDPIVAQSYNSLVATLLKIEPGSFSLSRSSSNRPSSTNLNPPIKFTEQKDIAELSILKNMLKNPEYCQIVEQYYGIEIFKDKATYRAVTGSQSSNNEHIRELELYENLEEYKSVEDLHNAIRPLAIRYYEGLLKSGRLSIEEIIECKKRISILKGKR